MTTGTESTDTSPAADPAAPAAGSAAPPSWPWRRAALFLAGAAQLITIAAVLSVDPIPVTWSSLLLAIAPVLLAAAAGVVVLVEGTVGQITHTGVLFVPALVALAVGGVKLWREQSVSGRR